MQESARNLLNQVSLNQEQPFLVPREFHTRPIIDLETHQKLILESNRENFFKLIDLQEETGEACFFVGLFGLSSAIYPEKMLPDANSYWDSIRSCYQDLVGPKKLNIKYEKIGQALSIYEEWGIKLDNITVNRSGEEIIGQYIDSLKYDKSVSFSWNSLDTSTLRSPYGVLLHQPGANNSHFVTIDGSEKTRQLQQKYLQEDHKVIATFQFSKFF